MMQILPEWQVTFTNSSGRELLTIAVIESNIYNVTNVIQKIRYPQDTNKIIIEKMKSAPDQQTLTGLEQKPGYSIGTWNQEK